MAANFFSYVSTIWTNSQVVSSLREYCFTAVMGIEEHGFRTQAQCLKLPLVESPSERNHLIIYQYYKKESVSHFLSNYIPNLSTRKQQSMNILGNTWIYRMRPLTFSRNLEERQSIGNVGVENILCLFGSADMDGDGNEEPYDHVDWQNSFHLQSLVLAVRFWRIPFFGL